MKLEFATNQSKAMSREEATKTDRKLLAPETILVTVSCDDVIILRTSRLDEVQQIFQNCLSNLKKVTD